MTLSGVEWQSAMYADRLPPEVRLKALTVDGRLPFVFEASGSETHFTNGYDPQPRARRLFNVPKPETLARIPRDAQRDPTQPTWRALPVLDERPIRKAQVAAIRRIEKSLAEQRFDRLLVRMATGAGGRVRILRLISGQSGCLPDRRSAVRTRLVPAG
jgi:type I restriction enzyme R subunit